MWWMYLVDYYFQVMVGLMNLEDKFEETTKSDANLLLEMKTQFLERVITYRKEKKIFFLEDDIETLKKINIDSEYKEVLEYKWYSYIGDKELDYMIKLSSDIFKSYMLK